MAIEEQLKRLETLREKKDKLEKEISELENTIKEELGKYGIPLIKYIEKYPATTLVTTTGNYPLTYTNHSGNNITWQP